MQVVCVVDHETLEFHFTYPWTAFEYIAFFLEMKGVDVSSQVRITACMSEGLRAAIGRNME